MKSVVVKGRGTPLEKLYIDAFDFSLNEILEENDAKVKIYFAKNAEDACHIGTVICRQYSLPPIIPFFYFPEGSVDATFITPLRENICILNEEELRKLLSYDAIVGLAAHATYHLKYQRERMIFLDSVSAISTAFAIERAAEEYWVVDKSAATFPGSTMAFEWELAMSSLSEFKKQEDKLVKELIRNAVNAEKCRLPLLNFFDIIASCVHKYAKRRALETSDKIPASFVKKILTIQEEATSLEKRVARRVINSLRKSGHKSAARIMEEDIWRGSKLRAWCEEKLTPAIFRNPDELYYALRELENELL